MTGDYRDEKGNIKDGRDVGDNGDGEHGGHGGHGDEGDIGDGRDDQEVMVKRAVGRKYTHKNFSGLQASEGESCFLIYSFILHSIVIISTTSSSRQTW